jgi:hypothetical protein
LFGSLATRRVLPNQSITDEKGAMKSRPLISFAGSLCCGLLLMAVALVSALVSAEESVVVSAEQDSVLNGDRAAEGVRFFNAQIAPILERRCYACHSHESGKAKGGLVLDSRQGWEKGGSEGAAIVPGKPDESLLMAAIRYESYEMPPDEPLSADEVTLLEKWIAIGAPDPRESKTAAIDPTKLWALQPISKPVVPTVTDASWPRDDLDAFILAKLDEAGLHPVGSADRYTLLRRLTFDLTGLPPTPEEIAAFVHDPDPRAYERAVDRLLESPGFGDQWARHWFDLSCYADLADVQGDVLIRDAWRYRDYVIGALNADKPLDRFIHEQIAGDLLPYEDDEQQRTQMIATGFLAIGPWTLQNYIKGQLAADVVDHQIDRIGRTFLGQTISCARCHDHKFDPIPTADYYALAGIFHSTLTTSYDGPGVWSQIHQVKLPMSARATSEFQRLSSEIGARQQALQVERAELQRLDDQSRFSQQAASNQANSLTLQSGLNANQEGREYRVGFDAGPSAWATGSQATTEQDGLVIQVLRADGTVLAYHVHRPRAWSGTGDAQRLDAASFVYTGDGTGHVTVHITSSDYTGRFSAAIDNLTVTELGTSQVVFAETFDAFQLGGIEAQQADTGLPVYAQCSLPSWRGGGINHSHVVELSGDRLPRADDVGQEPGATSDNRAGRNFALQIFSGPAIASENGRIAEIDRELARIRQRLNDARPDRMEALAVQDVDQPIDSPIYRRGDFQSLGDVVPRGFLSAVPVSEHHAIPASTSGRLQLAQWLTDPGNPLTSRVLVNRIWHHLFGNGLVRSVDYFGVHGETPSHPELLDFLANRFRDDDQWSLKKTIRRIVLSRTYQLGSPYHATADEIDPDNRLLSHMPRRRLAAESIRDAMLAASGQLDTGRGGPSLGLELDGNIVGLGGNVNPPSWAGKIADDVMNRRSVYLPFKRERPVGHLEILSIFDFPHPSDITGARPHTTVATQALFLLNSPFVKQQAKTLAERVCAEHGDDELQRIQRLYLLTISRPAALDEIEMTRAFLDQCTRDLSGDRLAAWTQLCHAMLGSNAFLFCE